MKILCCMFVAVSLLQATEYSTDATIMGNNFKNNFNSTIAKPGTENAPFQTIDGKKSFSSQITCNSSKVPVARISYTGTSDININLEIDINADGTVDKYNSINGVSGICADGIIKCNSNSWNNCGYYKYQYTSNGFSAVNMPSRLENCYCINNSCGNRALNQKNIILNDIAGSIYTIMSTSLSSFVLTRTEATNNEVKIYGENPQQCKNYQQGTKIFNQNSIKSDGDTLMSEQSNNPDSPTYIVAKAGTNNEVAKNINEIKSTNSTRLNAIKPASENNKIVTVDGFGTTDLGKMENTKETKYCQIAKDIDNGDVYTDQSTAYTSNTTNKITESFELRECIGENSTICPYETPERLKYDCGKISKDGFNTAVGGMSSVNEMAKDISCGTN